MTKAPISIAFATLFLMACGQPQPSGDIDVYDLRLAERDYPGVQRLEYKSVVLDEGGDAPNNIVQALRGQKITSTAYYKYWMQSPGGTGKQPYYKVKINVFADAAAAIKAWDGRYPADALRGTRPVGLGDVSYELPDKIVGWRDDYVVVELSAHDGADELVDFASRYAAHIARVR